MNDEFKDVVEETNEKAEAQTAEQIEEGIELTDTTDADETEVNEPEIKEDSEPKGKYYSDEELNQMINDAADKRVARKLAKIEREHAKEISKYKDTDNVLRTTLNLKEDDDTNTKLREYYESEGIKLPEAIKPGLSEREIEILANADAEEIIEDGHEAMISEAERLAKIGYKNLNPRERVIFNRLAETLTNEKDKTELLKLGAKEELLSDKKFIEFRKMFNSNTPIEKVYELYKQQQPKAKVENPGSMRNEKIKQPKTIFTDEDIAKMSDEDLDANWDAIRKYQTSGNH